MKSHDEILEVAWTLSRKFALRSGEHDKNGSFPYENFDDIRTAGYPMLAVPEALGGWGASLLDAVKAQEIIAQGDGSTALAITMHIQVVGAEAAAPGWKGETFANLCHEIVQRQVLVNACATEPELGSPMRGGLPKTTAYHTPEGWIINGRKSFATLSPVLDYFIVPAAVEGTIDEIATFLMPRQSGIRIEETWDAMGMRSTGSHDIIFTDACVPDDLVIARAPVQKPVGNQLWGNAWFILNVTAVYVGVAAAAQQFALQYAQERIPTALGKPISTLEGIQRRLGESELALNVARTLLYNAAETWDRYPELRGEIGQILATAKITATNNAIQIVDNAMRVVGGTSMLQDLPLARYYRDVRAGLYHPPIDDMTLPLFGRLALEQFVKVEQQ